jgi:hypothetical protein
VQQAALFLADTPCGGSSPGRGSGTLAYPAGYWAGDVAGELEIVRRSIEAWNRRDLTTMAAPWGSDGEVDWSRARGPFKGVYRGGGIESFFKTFWSTFEDIQLETHGFTEAAPKSWSRTPPALGAARGSK